MERRKQLVFLALVLAQGAHFLEEHSNRLYEVLAPAHFVSSLFSDDLQVGFVVFNVIVFAFGMWCWAVPVRLGWSARHGLMWGWALVELANGIAHIGLAASVGGYFPGLFTAPLLILMAGWLAMLQFRRGQGGLVSS